MTSTELAVELRQYVGRRVRISSAGGGSRIEWYGKKWPMLSDVTVNGDVVWCHSDDGCVSWVVTEERLVVDVDPAVGTFDYELGAKQMEMVAAATARYGPTPKQKKGRCSCVTCRAENAAGDAAREEEYVKLEAERDALLEQLDAKLPTATEILEEHKPKEDDRETGGMFKGW